MIHRRAAAGVGGAGGGGRCRGDGDGAGGAAGRAAPWPRGRCGPGEGWGRGGGWGWNVVAAFTRTPRGRPPNPSSGVPPPALTVTQTARRGWPGGPPLRRAAFSPRRGRRTSPKMRTEAAGRAGEGAGGGCGGGGGPLQACRAGRQDNRVHSPRSFMSAVAPFIRSRAAARKWPPLAARCRGAVPRRSATSTAAPARRWAPTLWRWPSAAARCGSIRPRSLTAPTAAPSSTRAAATSG